MYTVERNYRIGRRVYQQLYLDVAELFAQFIRSLSSSELQDFDEDISANGWGIKKISEVSDAQELIKIFQDFYSLTGRLLLSNSLLVVPDGDAPPEEKLNMRQLYDLFKNTNSHVLVSLPFLGLIQYYLEENDHSLIKNATSELYFNLSYTTLSGTRNFRFDDVSELTARLSILLKHATLWNKHLREIENETLAKKINDERSFEVKIEDPLDEVVEIIDVPDTEHKKSMFPFVEPTVETADEIETNQQIIDDDFIDLQTKFDQVNELSLNNNNKKKKIEETIESVVDDTNPFSTFDNFWWEDEMFSQKDSVPTVEASKNILEGINEISDNIPRNLRPVDTRTEQETIEDQHIPIDNRTQQELEDDDYLSFESESEDIEIENIDTSAWDDKKSTAAKPGAIFKLSTDYNKKVKAANKIKNKYLKKRIGNRKKSKKISSEWLKTAGYLDTKDQDKINYVSIAPKKETTNNIPADAAHFIRTEIDSTDFKKENLGSKVKKNKTGKPYISFKKETDDISKDTETTEILKVLVDIAALEPGKNAQLAAKKISEKYKKIREATARKNRYKLPGEIELKKLRPIREK